jgi:hypothetical protein
VSRRPPRYQLVPWPRSVPAGAHAVVEQGEDGMVKRVVAAGVLAVVATFPAWANAADSVSWMTERSQRWTCVPSAAFDCNTGGCVSKPSDISSAVIDFASGKIELDVTEYVDTRALKAWDAGQTAFFVMEPKTEGDTVYSTVSMSVLRGTGDLKFLMSIVDVTVESYAGDCIPGD